MDVDKTNTSPDMLAEQVENFQEVERSEDKLTVLAPVKMHDVSVANNNDKVPMVMVPVPESKTLTTIPMSQLNHLKEPQVLGAHPRDEQQARELLNWNDGVGTLHGCDLKFKINQLGCLELVESDDEPENKQNSAISSNNHQQQQYKPTNNSNNLPVRQISPGSSLLRDGPDIRRAKLNINCGQPGGLSNSTGRHRSQQGNSSLSLLKKIERNQSLAILEKLIPKEKLEDFKARAESWTTEDVRNFVDSIPGCAGYGQLFESQQICGKSLMYLDQKDLLDVINVKLGPAVKIYNAISLLK